MWGEGIDLLDDRDHVLAILRLVHGRHPFRQEHPRHQKGKLRLAELLPGQLRYLELAQYTTLDRSMDGVLARLQVHRQGAPAAAAP
ncbi:hypothetical protein CD932_26965 [Janthinobacterium sp. PC23-8]|nr:hypothetical protein CD932_26965 [Janthinobacterium sp. PC23-8]